MLKRSSLIILLGIIFCQSVPAQLEFSQKRSRDQAYHQAVSLIIQGNLEQAGSLLTQCISIDSTFASAYLQRGRIMIEWEAFDRALEDLDRALALNPGLAEACFYKGYILFGRDTTGLDAALFNDAIKKGYENPYAYYFRGLTEIRGGLDGRALNDFDRALELDPEFAAAYHERAGVKRRRGDLQGAHHDYSIAIEYQPDFPLAYNNMGSVKMLLGDYEGAIEDYNRALELDPGFVLSLNNRGYAKYFLGFMDEALEDFSSAVNFDSDFTEACLNKSTVLARRKQVGEALDLLNATIARDSGSYLLYLNRGLIRELKGDLKGACQDWKRAKELGAENTEEYLEECE